MSLINFFHIQFWLPGWCSCQPGWQGDICERPCDPGYYGDNCQSESECQNGARTHHVTGECFCTPGWAGLLCENPCPIGKVLKLDFIFMLMKNTRWKLWVFWVELKINCKKGNVLWRIFFCKGLKSSNWAHNKQSSQLRKHVITCYYNMFLVMKRRMPHKWTKSM